MLQLRAKSCFGCPGLECWRDRRAASGLASSSVPSRSAAALQTRSRSTRCGPSSARAAASLVLRSETIAGTARRRSTRVWRTGGGSVTGAACACSRLGTSAARRPTTRLVPLAPSAGTCPSAVTAPPVGNVTERHLGILRSELTTIREKTRDGPRRAKGIAPSFWGHEAVARSCRSTRAASHFWALVRGRREGGSPSSALACASAYRRLARTDAAITRETAARAPSAPTQLMPVLWRT